MVMDSVTAIVLCTLVLVLTWWLKKQPRLNLPPGPYKWPVVGNLFLVWRKLNEYENDLPRMFKAMAKTYGNIFSMKAGSLEFVILTHFDTVNKALVQQKEDFSERPSMPTLDIVKKNGRGIILSNNKEALKHLRRFSLMALRDFGVGKKSLEYKIIEETEAMCHEMEIKTEPFSPHILINNGVSNIICSIVFGDRYEYNNPKFDRLLKILTKSVNTNGVMTPENIFPWLSYIWKDSYQMETCKDLVKSTHEIIQEQIDQHKATYDPNNIRDFIDRCIQKMKEEPGSDIMDEKTMRGTIFDLFLAGTETTSTTLRWAIVMMCLHPDMQEKVHQEIMEIIGDRAPTYNDRTKTPYIEAILMETQRYGSIVPLSVVHANNSNAKLMGFDIPANSIIVPNLYSCHYDPDCFPEPDKFIPERWLNEDNKIRKNDSYMPFSTGPRACLGESLARMELYLIFVDFFQQFKFTLCELEGGSLKPVIGLIRSPSIYKVSINRY